MVITTFKGRDKDRNNFLAALGVGGRKIDEHKNYAKKGFKKYSAFSADFGDARAPPRPLVSSLFKAANGCT